MPRPKTYPSKQNMVSLCHPEQIDVENKFRACLAFIGASDPEDITIGEFDSHTSCPPEIHYTLTWNTYAGWRVYMLMTGVIILEKEEPNG